jgi:hypothetical protein
MKKNLILIAILLICSCVDEDNSIEIEVINKQPLIFDQVTGENESSLPPILIKSLNDGNYFSAGSIWMDAAQSRSTSLIVVDTSPTTDRRGSGKLASSNIIMTAEHNIDGNITSDIFKVKYDVDYIFTPSNGSIKDDLIMRLRLKSLGLDPWSDSNQIIHPRIRTTFENWEVNLLAKYAQSNRSDIAILKVNPKTIDNNQIDGANFDPKYKTIPSWQAPGPGMFFDFIKPKCFGKCKSSNLELQEQTQLTLHHFNLHMDPAWISDWRGTIPTTPPTLPYSADSLMERIVNVSYFSHLPHNVQNQRILDVDFTAVLKNPITMYECDQNFSAQLDTKRGSSGGAVLSVTLDVDGVRTELKKNWIGIVSAIRVEGNMSSNENNAKIQEQDVNSNIYYQIKEFLDQAPSVDVFNVVAKILELQIEKINENIGNNGVPYLSNPSTCTTTSSCYDNCSPTDTVCKNNKLETEFAFTVTGPGRIDEQEGCIGSGCLPMQLPPMPARDGFRMLCPSVGGLGDRVSGMAVGFVGSPSTGTKSDCIDSALSSEAASTNFYLGEVGLVCAPYSYREWSMNWDFLSTSYITKKTDCVENIHDYEDSSINPHYVQSLNDYISSNYLYIKSEEQDSSFKTVLPAPIQMCPPGYILRGVEVNKTNTGAIKGILGLHCIDVRKNLKDAYRECGNRSQFKTIYPCYIPTNANLPNDLFRSTLYSAVHGTVETILSKVVIRLGDIYKKNNIENFLCLDGLKLSEIKSPLTEETSWLEFKCNRYK